MKNELLLSPSTCFHHVQRDSSSHFIWIHRSHQKKQPTQLRIYMTFNLCFVSCKSFYIVALACGTMLGQLVTWFQRIVDRGAGGSMGLFCLDQAMRRWVFQNIGVPPKWMVYNGKPYWNGWFGGKPTIFGNIQMTQTWQTLYWSVGFPVVFLCSPLLFGEDEPILTSMIFFENGLVWNHQSVYMFQLDAEQKNNITFCIVDVSAWCLETCSWMAMFWHHISK